MTEGANASTPSFNESLGFQYKRKIDTFPFYNVEAAGREKLAVLRRIREY